MFFDYYYFVLVLPAVIFAFWASSRVNSTFKKYSGQRIVRGFTGRDAAEAVLRQNGITDVRIEKIPGNLTDHYDPRTKVIRLSENVYSGTGAKVDGMAYELAHTPGAELMRTKYCIRHELGMCPVHQGAKNSAPLYLLNNGKRLAVKFDCRHCEMIVTEEN